MDRRSLFPFTIHVRICDRCNHSSTNESPQPVALRRPAPVSLPAAPLPSARRPWAASGLQLRLCAAAAHCPLDHCPPRSALRTSAVAHRVREEGRRQRTEVVPQGAAAVAGICVDGLRPPATCVLVMFFWSWSFVLCRGPEPRP